MSIYDDLANSDFMDPGKFREQLKQLSALQESQESHEAGEHSQLNEAGHQNAERDLQDRGRNDQHLVKMNEETLKRQKIMQEQNPMDDENDGSMRRNVNSYQNAGQIPGGRQDTRLGKEDLDVPIQNRNQYIKEQQRRMEGKDKDLNFQQQAKQASHERSKFESQTRMRQSIEEDDLLDEDTYGDQQPHEQQRQANSKYLESQQIGQVDSRKEQRNRMIFDDNLEMSERREHGISDQQDSKQAQQVRAINDQLNMGSMKEEKIQANADVNNQHDPVGNNPSNNCHFTLNKYESRPDLMKKTGQTFADHESQMETAHFKKQGGGPGTMNSDHPRTNTEGTQKTENPDRDQMLIDQRGFQAVDTQESGQIEEEGTGQFGGKTRWDERNSLKNVQVEQFQAEKNQHDGGKSPQIKDTKYEQENDQISQLLAQLQAPMGMDPLDGVGGQAVKNMSRRTTGADQDQMKLDQFDIEKAHKQMQESIKLMKLVDDPVNIAAADSTTDQGSIGQNGMGFNGQNSLYELAQRVGQPLSSSNLNSMSNYENGDEFQKFLQGEGSLGSANTNNFTQNNQFNGQYGAQSQLASENPTTAINYNNHNQDQAQQLLIQMQDSSDTQQSMNQPYQRPSLAKRKSNQGINQNDNKIFQNAAQNVLLNEKENYNDKNIIYHQYHQFDDGNQSQFQQHQHQLAMLNQQFMPQQLDQQPKMKMSLAARAAQANELAKQKAEQQSANMPQQQPHKMYNQYAFENNQQQIQDDNANYRQRFDPAALLNNNENHSNHAQFDQQYSRPSRPSQIEHLQQVPYQGQNTDFSKTNPVDKAQKRKALMAQFDDIPIHELHKADGYQERNIDDDDATGGIVQHPNKNPYGNEGFDKTAEEDLQNLSLKDQTFHPKWKVRMNAFKKINQEFVNYKGPSRNLQKEDEMYGDPENPFDMYGPILEQMIKDSNLTAQYEGLNCLYSFVKYGQDIKSVTFSCHSTILDKIQHNKPNLRDVSQRTLLYMLQKKQNIVPEILKRFKSKNRQVIQFCLDVMNKALNDGDLVAQDANLKLIFRQSHDLLGHQAKEIRDSAIQLITFVYENCEDDLNSFCQNLKSLRPVQLKELKDQLSNHQKDQSSEYLVKLFDKVSNTESRKDLAMPEKSPANRSKSVESNKNKPDQREGKDEDGKEEASQIDLSSLVPENFNEIPYLSQINVKRKKLESFNQELEKVVQKQREQISAFEGEQLSIVKMKDYSSIFNIVVHMLEDPNMLVFNEAIKMVEHLSILLKQTIKAPKMKQFVQILADKYKETKTAVLTALEKTFAAIYENRCMPAVALFDQLINQIALSHKNPRVKQLVIDRVEIIIEKNYLAEDGRSQNPQQLLQIFKQVKDKLKQIILKDTNANVRDAGVSLLAQFRIILGSQGNFEDFQPVLEVINSLPKQRVSEIAKRLEIFEAQIQVNSEGQYSSRNIHEDRKSARDRSRGQSARSGVRGQGHKSNERAAPGNKNPQAQNENGQNKDPSQPNSSESPIKADQNGGFLFQTKKAQMNISNQYQASLSDIILTIKNISQDNDRLRSNQITQNFESGLELLGEDGIKECKTQIVACIFWLLTNHPQKVNFLDPERQVALKSIINLLKKLYCIDRSVSDGSKTQSGESLELHHAVSAALICFALIQDSKLISQLLNIVYVAATSQGRHSMHFINALKQAMTKYDPCPKKIQNGKALILSNTVYFVADKMPAMMLKSQTNENLNEALQLSDFEEFRSIVIQQLEHMPSEEDRQILIQSLVYLKDQLKEYQQNQIHTMRTEESQNFNDHDDNLNLPEVQKFDDQEFEQNQSKPYVPRHQEVVDLINQNFEQGLLKLKELVKDEQNGQIQITFEQKEQIINLLLKLTTSGYKNPQEQCKQAYSLKALMWLKEEFIGLEETFKLTSSIMDAFAQAVIDGRDSSIEQYLLNFWTKNLSLRDTVDRIQISTKFASELKDEVFNILFSWIFNLKISPDNQEGNQLTVADWILEDFRKVAPMVARAVIHQSGTNGFAMENIWKFVELAAQKFGAKKVRDFMEIQLIHENDLLIRFLDIFDSKYGSQCIKISQSNHLDDKELAQAVFNRDEGRDSKLTLNEPLLTNRSGNGSNAGIADRQMRFQEMRDRRKEQQNIKKDQLMASGAEEEDFSATLAEEKKRYEEIMHKLDNYKSSKRNGTADGDNEDDQRIEIENVENMDRFNLASRAGGGGRATAQSRERGSVPDSTAQNRQVPPQTSMSRMSNSSHRYATQNMRKDGTQQSLEEFNDEEDFKLSTDYQNSMAQFPGANGAGSVQTHHSTRLNPSNANRGSVVGQEEEDVGNQQFMQDRLNMQKNGQRANQFQRKGSFGEGLKNEDKQFLNQSSEQELQESRRKLRESVQTQEERLQRLESSQIKVRQYRNELETLEEQKKQLEIEKQQLLNEQNKESEQWKARYAHMTSKNDEIVANLGEANKCYMRQVTENEKLARQIQELQEQHREFSEKYKDMEQRLEDSMKQVEQQKIKLIEESHKSNISPQRTDRSKFSQDQVIEEKQLQQIEKAFDKNQMMQYGSNMEGKIGVRKIQELLLDSEGRQGDLSKPMIFHYQKLRSKVDRMEMMQALKQSLENEDILFAINQDVYKSLLNFLLKAFSFEKELIERESLQQQHEREQQNELTQESQRLVSKLLNSKEFTASLIGMLQLLKTEAMPDDFSTNLTIQERQYLRVIMRCISRITKAMHSENPDLIRAFDVLLEMQKLFKRHPPENLRQDLPCLQDFDFVYRGLKDVSDKLIELHPQKCLSFLEFCDQASETSTQDSANENINARPDQQENAFIKYLRQMMQVQKSAEY